MRLLAGTAAFAMCAGAVGPLPASATTKRPGKARANGADDPQQERKKVHTKSGNGNYNRSVSAVDSPTTQNGTQHTSSSNLGGSSSIQNALCKHVKKCHIVLNVIVVSPTGKVKKTQHKKVVDSLPKKHEPPATPDETSEPEDECGC